MKRRLEFDISANDKFSRIFGKLNKRLQSVKGITSSISQISNVGLGAALGGAGVLASMSKALEGAEKFQSSFANVSKVLNGFNEKEIAGVKKGILDLSKTIPLATDQLNIITEEGAKMGLPKESLLGFTEVVAKASTALGLSTDEISASFGKISGIYGVKSTEGLKEIGDVVNYLADNLETNGANIIEVMKRIGANAVNLNIAPNVAAGIAAAFDKLGVSPEKSATAFNSLIDGLSKTAKYKKILEEEGEGGLRKILTEISNMGKSERSSLIQNIAGSGGDAVMLKSLTNDIGVYIDAIDKATAKEKYSGSLQREFEIQAGTYANQKILLANAFERLSISMTPFLRILTDIVKKIIPVIDRMSQWASQNETLTKIIMVVVGAVGAFLVIGGSLVFILGNILNGIIIINSTLGLGTAITNLYTGTMARLGGVVKALGITFKAGAVGARLLSVALISTGIGAIIVGIGLAVALIYENWDLIVKKVGEFGDYLKNMFPIIGKITETIGGIFGDFFGEEKNVNVKKENTITGGSDLNFGSVQPKADLNVEINDNRTRISVKESGAVNTKVADNGRSKAGLGGYSFVGA